MSYSNNKFNNINEKRKTMFDDSNISPSPKIEKYENYNKSIVKNSIQIGWECLICTFINDHEKIACEICLEGTNPEVLNKLNNEYSNDNNSQNNINNYNIQNKYNLHRKNQFNCEIAAQCEGRINIDKTISLMNCDHKYCIDDIIEQLKNLIFENKLHDEHLKCPFQECNQPIELATIISLLQQGAPEQAEKFTNQRTNLIIMQEMYTCPNCNIPFDINNISDYNITRIDCPHCNQISCKLCKENQHENTCDKTKRDKTINELISAGVIVKQCPKCNQFVEKKGIKECDILKCYCGIEFCQFCQCLMEPVLMHGNHYHRPNCQHYRIQNGVDNVNNKCFQCRKFDKLCDRPNKLKSAQFDIK